MRYTLIQISKFRYAVGEHTSTVYDNKRRISYDRISLITRGLPLETARERIREMIAADTNSYNKLEYEKELNPDATPGICKAEAEVDVE